LKEFWQLLRDGVDAISDIPSDRWDVEFFYDPDPDAPGKMITRSGGFLKEIDRFDPQFFGISPREALKMDPQQRLLLEVAWEALEHAGQASLALSGSRTGTFIGMGQGDYANLQFSNGPSSISAYDGTGTGFCFAPGRLSFSLGLQGPAMALDTACSTSLVAVHLACQSLRLKECDMALAGAVQLMILPENYIFLSKAGALSPDGRCKTFDADADGYSRAEGCGIVVLKRLSDAIADKDNILALIKGSAVNHDGPSTGFTAPNGLAQRAVIRKALRNARVRPNQVHYVEAHGTGTSLGDPIEVRAIGAVFGEGRKPMQSLILGSVKTNIGHLETAAGMASLIKMVLALQHKEIPPNLHFKQPNPNIPWKALPFVVPARRVPWKLNQGSRIGGISAFGLSGTNAHLVVEEAPKIDPVEINNERPVHVLTLSAKTDNALKELAMRYKKHLAADSKTPFSHVCYTANTGRTHYTHRLAVVAESSQKVIKHLGAFLKGSVPTGIIQGLKSETGKLKTAFLFTGQGSQYVGMGRQLYETQPVFRQALDHCSDLLQSHCEISLRKVLYPQAQEQVSIDNTVYAQPALFALEYALFKLWKSWGVAPSAVMGHSAGEYAAACAAGVFSVEDGLKLVAARARLMQQLPRNGRTAAVFADEARKVAQQVNYSSPRIGIVSNVTGKFIEKEIAAPDYWLRHVRQPVRFADGIKALEQKGCEIFAEIGPSPVLLGMARQSLASKEAVLVPSLRQGHPDWTQLLSSLAELYVRGLTVDWQGFDREYVRRKVVLPTYPFQRRRYWIDIDTDEYRKEPFENAFKDWLYEVQWQARPRDEHQAGQPAAVEPEAFTWLIFADGGGVGQSLAARLKAQGHSCILVYPGGGYTKGDDGKRTVDPARLSDFEHLLQEIRTPGVPPLKAVVHLWSLDAPDGEALTVSRLDQAQLRGCASALHTLQVLSQYNDLPLPRLWLVTRNAVPAGEVDTQLAVAQSPLWGLGNVISLEHPDLWGGMVDLSLEAGPDEVARLAVEIRDPQGEEQIAFRRADRYVARLVRSKPARAQAIALQPDATYLITGGLGALGLRTAQWLVEQGARRLVLLGRRGAAGKAREFIDQMTHKGADILVEKADVADEGQMTRVFEKIAASGFALRGVIHAAGVPGYENLLKMPLDTFLPVLQPKVAGGWLLHKLTQKTALDFFICFSSIASVWGSAGQAHYGAANHFLDMLAHYRRGRGLPGLSINWGPWSGGGMTSSEAQMWLTRMGVSPLPPEHGTGALNYLLGTANIQITVAEVDWGVFKGLYEARKARLLLEQIEAHPQEPVKQRSCAKRTDLLRQLKGAAAGDRKNLLTAYLQSEAARIMAFESSQLPGVDQGFFEMGMDSLMAMELKTSLDASLSTDIPLSMIFDCSTIQELSNTLSEEVVGEKFFTTGDRKAKAVPKQLTGISRTRPSEHERNICLSFAQKRLWFLDQFKPNSPWYNIPAAMRITGELDVDVLSQSFAEIVRRHESLRTTFTAIDGQPQQVIAPGIILPLIVTDLRQLHEQDREIEVLRSVREDARLPFNLAKGPLLRLKLLRLKEKEYVLVLNMHHIISDGWSVGVLIRELSALYEAFSENKSSPLPELPIQYADFAVWQQQWLQGAELTRQLSYWQRQLGGKLPVLDLPTDRPRPPVQTSQHGETQSFLLAAHLSEKLKELSKHQDVTLFMTLLAAFQTMLLKYTGQQDIIVGSPIANRNRAEIDGLIGFFVNTLVLRCDLSGNPAFTKLLARVKETTLKAYTHQDLPFEMLVEKLHPQRDLSRTPLFQVMFVLQDFAVDTLELPGSTVNLLELDTGTSLFDLTLSLRASEKGLSGSFEYNTDLFDAATINRMIGHFQILLEGIAVDPERRLSDLPILTESERNRILVDWNATESDYPKDKCIHHLFEARVEKTPDAVAVIFEKQSLTYKELNRRANRLARHLIDMGVAPDTKVAVCVERSLEMVVGLLAILKAGGAYVPLDPAFPSRRLEFILEDTQAPVLITQMALSNRFKALSASIVCLDRDNEQIESHPAHNPELDANPEGLAYILHTSGSTGKPKGVQIPHIAVVNFLLSMQQEPGITAGDILLAVTTISFDISVLELFLPLSVGACIVLADQPTAADGQALSALIRSSGATIMQATPVTWRLLFAAGLNPPQSLKVLCGGENLPPDLARRLCSISDSVWNLYGPTETTIWSTCARVRPDGPVTAGRPIANTRLYIVDRNLQLTLPGVAGELLIGGAGVSPGYLNRPELTGEKFIPDPFSGQPKRRLYRTGDIARYLADGRLQIMGRIDHQIKLHGFRIEPGEVEAMLAAIDSVKEAVVIVREDRPGDKRLAAYYTGSDAPAAETLRSRLSGALPGYMVPAAYVHLEALPLTPNRKIDRKALPAPEGDAFSSRAYEEPQGEVEQRLSAIWSELLNIEKIGRHDHFFELGGHSLLSIQMVSMLKQAGIDVQIAALFTHPTIERLAAYIEGEENPALPDGAIAIRRTGAGRPLFIVHEVSGEVINYAPQLARCIDADIPVYGLEDIPLGKKPLQTMYARAKRLARTIRAVQPSGPYRIAGWSFGGNLAYEIATHLLGEDETVEFIGLIDAINFAGIGLERQWPSDDNTFLLYHVLHIDEQTDDSLRTQLDSLAKTADFETFVRTCQEKQLIPSNISLEDVRNYLARRKASYHAMDDYHPLALPIPIYLFKAMDKEDPAGDDHLGWAKALPQAQIRVIPVPGTHVSIMETPQIEVLGRSLSDAIGQASVAKRTIPAHNEARRVTINAGQGGAPPVFCVPGAGSNMTTFTHMAIALRAQWPIHGLQPRGLNNGDVPHSTVPAASREYLRTIYEVYPQGPMHLIGHSFGGWVVFEMALQLCAAGREVASVTIIDAEAPEGDGILGREYNRMEVFMQLVELSEQSAERSLNLVADDFNGLDYTAQLELLHERLVMADLMSHRSKPEALHGMVRTFATNLRTTYVPSETYPGPVRLVLVRDVKDNEAASRKKHQETVAGWQRFAPGLVTWRGPGNHMTVLKPPHVATLTDWLRASL
jgi:amino acid adenylation domain-containing protein